MTWSPSPKEVDYHVRNTAELRTSDLPQWVDARRRLGVERIAPEDAVLADWQDEGPGLNSAVIVSRDGRVFDFDVLYYDEMHHGYEGGAGRIANWRELAADRLRHSPEGHPGREARAVLIARAVLEHLGA